ncbi:MAG: ParB/RepB/Spo0J family partition protein [Leptospira sp.]|nr:ParB/RepB/Spo0J family partition protein [Leptospira sp.]
MGKTNALGRGLGNLIPIDSRNKTISPDEHSNLREIKISEIKTNPNQPRKSFSHDSILELAETIKQHGVIQPIIVKKNENGYELVSGERRVRACKEAGFIKIPAIIKNYTEPESIEIAIIENIQRENLNPIEEAQAYQNLSEKLSVKISEIATKMGKNRSTIANLIRLLQLPESIKDHIKAGKLSEGQARPLLSIGDRKKMENIAELIIKNSWTARQVEEQVSKITEGKTSVAAAKQKKQEPSIQQLENKIRNKLSAKVSISHNANTGKGKIILSYANLAGMERILENLGIKQ